MMDTGASVAHPVLRSSNRVAVTQTMPKTFIER